MNPDLKFEPAVIDAIQRGKKIEAIKILRESRNVDLKEAKDLVDQYYKENNVTPEPDRETGSPASLLFFIIFIGICYFVYQLFNG